MTIRIPEESPAIRITQVGAWTGEDADGTYLIRLYSDGRMTAERKMAATGQYTGEVTIAPEEGWWDARAPLVVVPS